MYQSNQLNLRTICNKIGTQIELIKLIFTDLSSNKKRLSQKIRAF